MGLTIRPPLAMDCMYSGLSLAYFSPELVGTTNAIRRNDSTDLDEYCGSQRVTSNVSQKNGPLLILPFCLG